MTSAERDAAPDAFSVCVHRGTQQIGGTCIELSCQRKRILLDLGLPLDAGETVPATLLPPVPGLGDIRGHGRKAALFERLVAQPPRPVHAMPMEGCSLGRLNADQRFATEGEIEQRLADRLRAPGCVGVCASAQNIDRIVGLYRACKRTVRTLVLDL